jgi:hypothetical protein
MALQNRPHFGLHRSLLRTLLDDSGCAIPLFALRQSILQIAAKFYALNSRKFMRAVIILSR